MHNVVGVLAIFLIASSAYGLIDSLYTPWGVGLLCLAIAWDFVWGVVMVLVLGLFAALAGIMLLIIMPALWASNLYATRKRKNRSV